MRKLTCKNGNIVYVGTQEEVRIIHHAMYRAWLKDKDYVALAYMTGILPIKKYGSHSALNMFTEYSMTNPREMAEYFGFTEKEVTSLCERISSKF